MSGAVLLTGASGFIGMETLARLIEREEPRVIALARGEDERHVRRRLEGALAQLFESPGEGLERVQTVRGDLLQPGLGLSPGDRRLIVASVERIVHCAASISFDLPLAQARAINLDGVARIVELAREIAAEGSLRKLVHVSTAYVSGSHDGVFGERELDLGQRFRNSYERSKHEAELLLAGVEDLPLAIARPSIVVGHRASGWTSAFNVLYWPIRAAERGLLRDLPARAGSLVDFVPVDYVADGLLALLDEPTARGAYNLVAGEHALSVGELVELHALASGRPPVRLVGEEAGVDLLEAAGAYAPYFDVRTRFADPRMRALLEEAGIEKPRPLEYLPRLLAYAHATRWGKRPMSREAAARRFAHV